MTTRQISPIDIERGEHAKSYANELIQEDQTNVFNDTFPPFNQNETYISLNEETIKEHSRDQIGGETKYERLQKYNDGNHSLNWTDRMWLRRCDDWNRCWAVADTFDFSTEEIKRICRLYDRHLTMYPFPSKQYGEQEKWVVVPLCICILVHNESQPQKKNGKRDSQYAYYPGKQHYPTRTTYDGSIHRAEEAEHDRHVAFREFEESLSLDTDAIISCLEKLRRKLPDFHPSVELDFVRGEAENRITHTDFAASI